MTDFNKMLGQLMGSGAAGGFAGGLAGGLAGNLITSKSGRKMGKKAMKMGGVAAVGALAYAAFQRFTANTANTANTVNTALGASQPPPAPPELAPAPPGSAFIPAQNDTAGQEALGLILVRAMIAAARSDGRLDAKESQAIFQRIESLGLDAQDQSLLIQEMGHPVDMDAIVNSATSPEAAAEIYVASLMAIDTDTAEEQSYLSMLAARLNIPTELALELRRQVEAQS